uniref:Aminotransferase-like plant mobile domain-containing protein n=1 Tax=Oryza brachyantha TaxID=4533 RepID=J3M557_ORYBR
MAQRPMPLYNAAALISLVDQWRPETHTFHLPSGELMVTLEDVRQRVVEYLSVEPPVAPDGQRLTKTSGVPLSWLRANFSQCPEGANEDIVGVNAEPVLYTFWSILFPDSGGDMASWMWLDEAVDRRNLACYHYTSEMDYLQPEHVVWLPYEAQEVVDLDINPTCQIEADLQWVDRQNDKVTDWAYYHQDRIAIWDKLKANGVPDHAQHNRPDFDAYLVWLERMYRLFLCSAWMLADIADDPEDVEEQNEYDTRTLVGSTVETGPVCDRMRASEDHEQSGSGAWNSSRVGRREQHPAQCTAESTITMSTNDAVKPPQRQGDEQGDDEEEADAKGEDYDEPNKEDKQDDNDDVDEGEHDDVELGRSQLEDALDPSQARSSSQAGPSSHGGPSRPRRR